MQLQVASSRWVGAFTAMVARSNRARPTTKDQMNQVLTCKRRDFFMPKISHGAILKKHPQQIPTFQAKKGQL